MKLHILIITLALTLITSPAFAADAPAPLPVTKTHIGYVPVKPDTQGNFSSSSHAVTLAVQQWIDATPGAKIISVSANSHMDKMKVFYAGAWIVYEVKVPEKK